MLLTVFQWGREGIFTGIGWFGPRDGTYLDQEMGIFDRKWNSKIVQWMSASGVTSWKAPSLFTECESRHFCLSFLSWMDTDHLLNEKHKSTQLDKKYNNKNAKAKKKKNIFLNVGVRFKKKQHFFTLWSWDICAIAVSKVQDWWADSYLGDSMSKQGKKRSTSKNNIFMKKYERI